MPNFTTRTRKLVGDVIVAGVLLLIFAVGALSYFDLMLQDSLFQRPSRPHPDIIVIGIDEQAIEMFDTPARWSRDIYAAAIEILNSFEEYRPAVIALDILYVGEREAESAADERLAAAARDGGNVLVAARAIPGYVQSGINPGRATRTVVGFEVPFPALARYASYGVVNAIFDSDGRVRSTRLIYDFDGHVIYSFPYEILRKYFETQEREPWVVYNEMYIIYHGPPGTYKQFSFADIFEDWFEPEFLADTIVLIGAFSPGLFDDFQVPGYAERMFGVEIHANILQMLLEQNFKYHAPGLVNGAFFLAVIVLCFVLANYLEIRRLLAAYVFLVAACICLALFAFYNGYIFSVVYVVVSPAIIYIYQLIYGYVIESIERKKAQLVAEKHQILIDSINYASVIQKGILPKDAVFAQAFADYSVIWNPRDTVGGDIYWVKNFDKGALLAVCDCTGHGVPGALLTALTVSSLEEIVDEDSCADPASVIYMLDQKLARIFEAETGADTGEKGKRKIHIKNGCDLAVLFIAKDGEVTIASGNINVFICDGSEVSRIKGQRIYVGEGKLKSSEDVNTTMIPASANNKFYISSDGMYDQVGGTHGNSFGYTTFKKLILDNHNETQNSISDKIWNAFEAYRGNHIRLDDFELITFRPL